MLRPRPWRIVAFVFVAIGVAGVALILWGPKLRAYRQPPVARALPEVSDTPTNGDPLPTLATSSTLVAGSPVAQEYAALDPARDGWTSESVHEHIEAQMKQLGKLLAHPTRWDADQVAELAAADFSSGSLRPEPLVSVFDADPFSVMRSLPDAANDNRRYQGAQGWIAALRELIEPLHDTSALRLDVKIFHVELEDELATSHAYIVLSGLGSTRSIQQNATWQCGWRVAQGDAAPQLRSVIVKEFEQVTARTDSGPPFLDCTLAVLGGNACFAQQLVPGIDHWTSRIPQGLGMYIDGWSGLAIGDVNGDDLDDLYVCQPGGLPNRLFVQNPDGTATDVAASYRVDWLDRSAAALLVDLDNDSWQDLVIAIQGGVLIMQNEGGAAFRLRQAVRTTGQPYSLAAADFNDDGRVDIYVCCYNDGSRAVQQGGLGVPVPYYDANNGAPNVLLRNDGSFVLADVTAEVGMDVNNRRFSYACAWEDFDNDGDQDLYVANDFGRNNLYRNDGGHFADVAAAVGVEDVGSGMSVSWSDYDGDGWMDLYVGNMFSAAGWRVTYQRQFNPSLTDESLALMRRLARGNTLFQNAGDGTMRDVSFEAGVTMGRWAWSSNFVDINNDGRDDLVIANGFVTGSKADDL